MKSDDKLFVRTFSMDARLPALRLSTAYPEPLFSNWVRSYREDCQNNDEEKSQLEMMEELRHLRREKARLEKENSFLKSSGNLREGNRLVAYRFLDT